MVKYTVHMGIMQLFNIVLFWVFLGCLCSYLAKKQGKPQLPWFFTGLVLGIFGIILLYILPKKDAKKKNLPPRMPQDEAWTKMWYYLEPKTREQKGPMEFPDLAKNWRKKAVTDRTLIWGEGMDEWKKVDELPNIVKEMEKV